MSSRLEEQHQLLIKLGMLLAPVISVSEQPSNQTPQTIARVFAKYTYESMTFLRDVQVFASSEVGHIYQTQSQQIRTQIMGAIDNLAPWHKQGKLAVQIQNVQSNVVQQLTAIPCDIAPETLDAKSPYTAFLKIHALCSQASRKLTLVDPYVGPGVLRRYCRSINKGTNLTIITQRRSGQEFLDFLDLSRLMATERGTAGYRLMYYNGNQHDRLLAVDDTVYHIGGSLKDAGFRSDFTVTKMQIVEDAINKVGAIVANAEEVFGPSNTKHPLL